MSNISIGNLNDNYFSIDFAGKSDPTDTYRFNRLNTGSFRVTAEGFSSIIGMQLLDSQGQVVKDIETNGTNSGTFSIDNLGATNYALKISAPSGDTNYQVSLTPDGKVDPLTGLGVDSGFFATDSTGKVGFDWLHDGGKYQGEVAIFSVQGMEKFTPGSEEFIKEAARRAMSNSLLGHVVISDPTEGANPLFNGSLGEGNYNQGQYSGRKTFAMKPGEAFAVMLVPNRTVQEVFNNPNAGGDKRPLFSLSSSNPNDAWLYGQVADVTGSGKTFAMEDQRVDTGSDKDYNDLVFNLTGATGKAVSIDKVIDRAKDWTKLDGGKKLIDYVKSKQPIVEPPVAVGPSVQTKPPVAVGPPIEPKPPVAVTPPVATGPVETKPPVAVAPPVETPPVETKPPVAVAPPVETPPVETKPPVAVAPPVETPPIETKPPVTVAPPVETPPIETKPPVAVAPPVETPPVAVAPPIETTPSVATLPVATTPPVATLPIAPPTPPVQPPTIAPEAPLVGLGPIDDLSQPIDPEPPIEPVLPISSPPENRAFIGIIDTGFATNNPDLDYSKVTLGRDRIDKDSNPLFSGGEGNEHGTFSWGLVSAIQGNDKGIDGYNDKANVYLSRAIGSGEWDLALTDFVGEAKAQKQKNAIALLPLDLTQKNADGTITTRYEFTPRERAALENARQNGVLLVVAAGNDGGVMSVLGQSSQEFENILTVGSSDGFGRSDYSSYGYGLDILVPGGAIDNPVLSTVGDDLGTMAGTSASAAIAAGMASKVWESNPDLNATQVIDVLTGSAIDLNTPGWDKETGFGVVNLNKAVQLAKETAPQSYTPSAFITPITWDGEGKVTPMERATQNWNAVGDGRRKYVGWLNSSNPSDKLSFTVNQTIPIFQFGLKAPQQGSTSQYSGSTTTLYDSNGNAISTLSYNPSLPNEGLFGATPLNAGNYYVVLDKGSQSTIDPYEIVLNFTGLSGEVKPLDDTIYLPRPTVSPTPTPTPDPIVNPSPSPTPDPIVNPSPSPTPTPAINPIQVVGEIAKKYLSLGGENSWLGKPVQNQVEQVGGFIQQWFEHGYIPWNGKVAPAYQVGNGNPNVTVRSSQPTTNFVSPLNWKAEFINRTPSNAGDINFNIDRKDGQAGIFADIPSRVAVSNLGSQGANGKIKAILNADFGSNSPANNVQPDNFGMLASTQVSLEAGKTYKFTTKSDEGSAFNLKNLTTGQWIEPKDILVNPDFTDNTDWRDRGYKDPAKTVLFTVPQSGQYQLMFKLYDRTGAAQIEAKVEEVFQDKIDDISKEWQLEVYKWYQGQNTQLPDDIQTATTAGNGLEYMGRVSAGSNTRPDGTKGTRQDGAWNWGIGSPNHNDPRFPKDQFVVKGVTQADFKANQTYKFTVRADDGYQLYARYQDGTKEPISPDNQWQKDADNSKTIDFKPKKDGTYKVVAYMFENTGDAFFDLSWKEVAPPSSNDFKMPLPGGKSWYVTNGVGHSQYNWQYFAIDIDDLASVGQQSDVPVLAPSSGMVVKTGYESGGWGHFLKIDHEAPYNDGKGYITVYAHLKDAPSVTKGKFVTQGEQLGILGNTGNSSGSHLHFAVLYNDLNGDSSVPQLQNLLIDGRKLQDYKPNNYYLSTNS